MQRNSLDQHLHRVQIYQLKNDLIHLMDYKSKGGMMRVEEIDKSFYEEEIEQEFVFCFVIVE